MKSRSSGRMALVCSALILLLALPTAVAATHSTAQAQPVLVPTTTVCGCGASSSTTDSSTNEFRGHGPPILNNEVGFDEQIGITFTESFSSLEYNVTAIEQTDPTLDTGPAALLDGLSDDGYWYQVGLSWNWGPGENPGTGFDMNYEVFNPSGNSIDPVQGGGVMALSGQVNPGDKVALNLYFGNSSDVVMVVYDFNTKAFAEQTFSNEGASSFVGLDNIANSNGFFTGLMTEWYHGEPYYLNPDALVYSTNFPISSGWLWMDEFNPQNDQVVFAGNASAPYSFSSDPVTLQEYSYNGTTEYANATSFVTGALNSSSSGGTGGTGGTTGGPQVSMTFSYSVEGGGTGYSAPLLTYTSDGSTMTVALGSTPTAYKLDNGSQWSVSSALPGTSSGERWVAEGATSGTAAGGTIVSVQYQNQYYLQTAINDSNGGTVQPASGWQDAGTTVQVVATPVSEWRLEGWVSDNGSLTNGSSPISLNMTAPASEEAVFYPGLMVTTPGSVSVIYSYLDPVSGEAGSGTIQAGTTRSLYLPPTTEIVLEAEPTSVLYSTGWNIEGANGQTIALSLREPGSIAPESNYNTLTVAIIVAAVVLAILGVSVLISTRRSKPPVADLQPSPPSEESPSPPATPESGPSP